MKKNWLSLIGILLITINVWIFSKTNLQEIIGSPLLSLAQISALLGSVLISVELLLSSRIKIIQTIVGPLDKLYKYHRYIGVVGVIFLIFHATFLILNSSNGIIYIVPSLGNLIYAAGIISLYSFILTVIISLYLHLPYHIWKLIHKVLGLSTLAALYHILMIQSDISRNIPLRIWILSFIFSGVFSMLYKVFFYFYISPKYRYKIIKKENRNDVTILDLEAVDKRIQINPGQFAFFKFYSKQLSREDHPFSVIKNVDILKIAIKNLGDFSSKIKNVLEGESVLVYGPYGGFGDRLLSKRDQVWIAGGIGITPFLSFLSGLQGIERSNTIQLYYCTKCNDDAYFDGEIKNYSNIPNFQYVNFQSEISGHLSGDYVFKNVVDIRNTDFYLCGPEGMVSSIEDSLFSKGIRKDSIIKEEFNFLGGK